MCELCTVHGSCDFCLQLLNILGDTMNRWETRNFYTFYNNNNKLYGLSPLANYTDRATAASW
jgi:hypothetical protein